MMQLESTLRMRTERPPAGTAGAARRRSVFDAHATPTAAELDPPTRRRLVDRAGDSARSFVGDLSRVPPHSGSGPPPTAALAFDGLRDPVAQAPPKAPAPPAGPDAGVPAKTTFPTYTQITADKTVSTAMNAAWSATKKATTATTRREQGFWIKYDTSGSTYTCAPTFVGATTGAGATGAADPGAKPADAGTVFTVGLFHTHTPMTYRDKRGVRDVGPSTPDNTFHTNNNVAGVVYDYVESPAGSGTIPGGHPLDSAARLYSSGPTQRT